jgi:DNA polymerase-1
MPDKKKSLYIIDGYSLIYRSYFAFINRPLRDVEGNNVSALYGFFNTLLMLQRQFEIDYLVVAMDTKEKTFRHELYDQYKANRDAAPDDLHTQVPLINSVLEAANIPQIGIDGWEADDVIASLTKSATKAGIESVMVTGDKDLLQLVDEHVFALRPPRKGESSYRQIGKEEVFEEFGVRSDQIVDYLALIGDSSDNVPGVAGIGPKGAVKLLSEYDNLDEIYKNLDKLSSGVAKKLEESEKMAYLSKELVKLESDLFSVLDFNDDKFRSDSITWEKALPLFDKFGFKSLIAAIDNGQQQETKSVTKKSNLNKKGSYKLVESLEQLRELLDQMVDGKIIAFDFETTSEDEMIAIPVGFSFTNSLFNAYYVPLIAEGKAVLDSEKVKAILKEYLIDKKIALVGQNLKYEYKVFENWGLKGVTLYFDTMIAAWLLDAAQGQYNLDFLALKYLDGYQTIKYKDVVTKKDDNFGSLALTEQFDYAAEDADITWRLYEELKPLLEARKLEKLFYDVEMPLVTILADMELKGIIVDKEKLNKFDQKLTKRISEIEEEIYDEVGFPFNINSTKQLQEVLFEKRGLPTGKKTKTGYSTAIDTLEKLALIDIVPRLILENRTLVKLKNTYVEPLPLLINASTNRIHTSYTQTGTATGRLSSRNPNLQNIPIRSEEGRLIREAFIPQEGSLFLSADYSQIELVVLAHLADDPSLKEAFINGEDIHAHTASLIFNTFAEMVTSEQRRIAKTINFGVMYGMSAFRLSNELQISRSDAQAFINNYFDRFSKVRKFMDEVVENAVQTQKVRTILGREREVPEIISRNKVEQMGAQRIVVNTAIQGSAADIMKLAMLNVVEALKKESLKSNLLLQVHDELVFEVPEDEVDKLSVLVKREMENAYKLSIPIRVSLEVGKSWGEMH